MKETLSLIAKMCSFVTEDNDVEKKEIHNFKVFYEQHLICIKWNHIL